MENKRNKNLPHRCVDSRWCMDHELLQGEHKFSPSQTNKQTNSWIHPPTPAGRRRPWTWTWASNLSEVTQGHTHTHNPYTLLPLKLCDVSQLSKRRDNKANRVPLFKGTLAPPPSPYLSNINFPPFYPSSCLPGMWPWRIYGFNIARQYIFLMFHNFHTCGISFIRALLNDLVGDRKGVGHSRLRRFLFNWFWLFFFNIIAVSSPSTFFFILNNNRT